VGGYTLSPACGTPTLADYVVTTNPAGLPVIVDGAPYVAPAAFHWPQYSAHDVDYATSQVSPDTRYRFAAWSDGGGQAHQFWATTVPSTVTANLFPQHMLRMSSAGDGTVLPADDWFDEGHSVTIDAIPGIEAYFTLWSGSGSGSYSGTANPANVVMGGPVSQTASFAPIGYDFTISASDTDPFQFRASPTHGERLLYLWLTCANSGISAFEAGVTGTLVPQIFIPLGGALNAGTTADLMLAIPNCPSGENVSLLLGYWVVDDPGGTLCFVASPRSGQIAAVDCLYTFDVIDNPHVVGFSSNPTMACGGIGVDFCGDPNVPQESQAVSAPLAPGATEVFLAAPNPFAQETRIAFSLAGAAVVELAVYDVTGRLVHALAPKTYPAGSHALTWNGVGLSREPVPSGVYFLRLTAGDRTETRKVTLLRTR
jgi:hypothetical protein